MESSQASPTTWRNWAGNQRADGIEVVSPASADEVAPLLARAAEQGRHVRPIGSSHSFTAIGQPRDVQLRLDRLDRVLHADVATGLVTVEAGITLRALNRALDALGLALTNLGDIDEQTIAGAISTGTHGTGGRWASLSAQVEAFELVTGDGTVVHGRADGTPEEAELLAAGRVGLGALGVLTEVTLRVEPAFTLLADERHGRFEEVVDSFDELVAAHHHFEAYWFPHTDRMRTKANDRTVDDPEPLSRLRHWVDDELMENTLFGAINRVGNLVPVAIRPINRLSARAESDRTYSDVSHRVFTSARRVRFREMEYALPRAAGMAALTEVRALVERSDWRISFPVEVRQAPADDAWLSTAHDRDSVYLAFHVNARTDHTAYFTAVEQVLRAHDGRPHWGKLHTRTAADLAPAFPRFADFRALRDRLDPDRVFANPYLDRVLGP